MDYSGKKIIILCLIILSFTTYAFADIWKITAYCSCVKCCGKDDGITASGHHLKPGDKVVACNWLPFGTKVYIQGLGEYIVRDRGAKSLFGDKFNHIKHLDIWMPSHNQARKFGVKYREVVIK